MQDLNMSSDLQELMDMPMGGDTYEYGGMVGSQGVPVRPAGLGIGSQQNSNVNPRMMEMKLDTSLQENPEIIARVRAGIEASLQSGELDPQELDMLIKYAKTAAKNPDMYPQIRQLIITNGIANPEDIPEQYDQGLVIALLVIAKSMEADVQFEDGGMKTADMQQPNLHMMRGGKLPENSNNVDGSIPITAHEGEYVIPEAIVKIKGTEFFDKLLTQYSNEGSDGKTSKK